MTSPSVSGTSSSANPYPGNTGGSASVPQLQKQVTALQTKITKEQQSKDDAKTKAEMVQLYQVQLEEVEEQIQQAEAKAQQAEAGGTRAPAKGVSGAAGATAPSAPSPDAAGTSSSLQMADPAWINRNWQYLNAQA